MTDAEDDLFRVVYFSRNAIQGSLETQRAEVNAILETSQRNNRATGVSGVLVFNNGVFGQVLEGPSEEVEDTFDRIQADERHFDVTVLETAPLTQRSFAQWSMGFVGADTSFQSMFGDIGAATSFDLAALDAEKIFATLSSLTMKNEIRDRAE